MKIRHIVNVSGGKDSTATLLMAIERLGLSGFEAVFADTQHEHDDTYDYLNYLEKITGKKIRRVTADFSRQFKVKKDNLREKWEADNVSEKVINRAESALNPSGNAFLDAAKLHGGFPSSLVKFCTVELKIKPIEEEVIKPILQDGFNIVQWLGVRRDESPRRGQTPLYVVERWYGRHKEGQNALNFNHHRGGKTMLAVKYYPIRHWLLKDVFSFIEAKGLDINPLYKKGMSRVGCSPCIMARNKEREFLLRDQKTVDRLETMEAEVFKASKHEDVQVSSFFPVKTVPGAIDRYRAGGPPVYSGGQNISIRQIPRGSRRDGI